MKFEFMRRYSRTFSIEKMARILGVSRSGYYEFIDRAPSKRSAENEVLLHEIKKVHKDSRGTYGSPRVHAKLKSLGKSCSRTRVARLMRKENIQAKMRKKWKVTTKPSKKVTMIEPNHLAQNFTVEAPNKVWASDISYVFTEEGWLYVAVVMDLFSRRIVGLSMGDRLETNLVLKALKQALYRREVSEGLLHHSDRGCQYTSKEFREITNRHGIKLSMSAKGRCYDNAVVESFFHTLKTEDTHLCRYRIREEAEMGIFDYIETFYNRKRIHSTLGYMSPVDFEEAWESIHMEQVI